MSGLPFKLFFSQPYSHFQESGVRPVPGPPPHRGWFEPPRTSPCQSCASGTPRPAIPPSLCLQPFSARPAPQGAASLAQERTPPQSSLRSTWS